MRERIGRDDERDKIQRERERKNDAGRETVT